MMASNLVTFVAVVSSTFAADMSTSPTGEPSLHSILSEYSATLAPTRFASRDDDGQVYLTFHVPDHSAGEFEGHISQLDGVIAVYRKPGEELP